MKACPISQTARMSCPTRQELPVRHDTEGNVVNSRPPGRKHKRRSQQNRQRRCQTTRMSCPTRPGPPVRYDTEGNVVNSRPPRQYAPMIRRDTFPTSEASHSSDDNTSEGSGSSSDNTIMEDDPNNAEAGSLDDNEEQQNSSASGNSNDNTIDSPEVGSRPGLVFRLREGLSLPISPIARVPFVPQHSDYTT